MTSFETISEAETFVRIRVDVPVLERRVDIGEDLKFRTFSQDLGGGRFTNVYDVSYRAGNVKPTLHLHNQLKSVYEFASNHDDVPVTVTGSFFFLADRYSGLPRQLALNLAVDQGCVRSLPVVDREAVVSDGRRLSAESIGALGVLSINGIDISWAGSLTKHEADAKIFGNGNSIIKNEYNETTGHVRVLDERSRFTPHIEDDDIVDIGFVMRADGTFTGINANLTGNMDVFAHDIVVRCHERHLTDQTPEMVVRTIGHKAVDGSLQGALSVGPMITETDFEHHLINKDMSLGDNPPFVERSLARTVIYETDDGGVHLRLFDGRPSSEVFPGVTPNQVADMVLEEAGMVTWGCFLDPGQSAKLCIRKDDEIESLGNTHYLRWPTKPGGKFIWVPNLGRPVASMIALQ